MLKSKQNKIGGVNPQTREKQQAIIFEQVASGGDRNSLFDVGAAGPIGGMLVVIPVTIEDLSKIKE